MVSKGPSLMDRPTARLALLCEVGKEEGREGGGDAVRRWRNWNSLRSWRRRRCFSGEVALTGAAQCFWPVLTKKRKCTILWSSFEFRLCLEKTALDVSPALAVTCGINCDFDSDQLEVLVRRGPPFRIRKANIGRRRTGRQKSARSPAATMN